MQDATDGFMIKSTTIKCIVLIIGIIASFSFLGCDNNKEVVYTGTYSTLFQEADNGLSLCIGSEMPNKTFVCCIYEPNGSKYEIGNGSIEDKTLNIVFSDDSICTLDIDGNNLFTLVYRNKTYQMEIIDEVPVFVGNSDANSAFNAKITE